MNWKEIYRCGIDGRFTGRTDGLVYVGEWCRGERAWFVYERPDGSLLVIHPRWLTVK